MIQGDKERIKRMIATGERLRHYLDTHQIDERRILEEYEIQWAITTPLSNIGEQTYRLSSDLKDQHGEIPWARISGLRHRLVHDYEGTNWSVISNIVLHDLPIFMEQIINLLDYEQNKQL